MYCTELAVKSIAAAEIDIAVSLPSIRVMLLAEPVIPPDHLRRSHHLEIVLPNNSLQWDAPQAARPCAWTFGPEIGIPQLSPRGDCP